MNNSSLTLGKIYVIKVIKEVFMRFFFNIVVSLIFTVVLISGCSEGRSSGRSGNPYLSNSVWPIIHHSSSQDASSPLTGPDGSAANPPHFDYVSGMPGPGPVLFDSKGNVLLENVDVINMAHVFRKLDPVSLNTITSYTVAVTADPMNGLYSFVDYQDCWWNASGQAFSRLCFKGNTIVQDMSVDLLARFPTEITSDDSIIGMNPLYSSPGIIDIAFVTGGLKGVYLAGGAFTQQIIGAKVGVMRVNKDRSISLFVQNFTTEDISNNFAVAPDGSIYVVTDKHAVKLILQQTCACGSEELNVIWSVPYDSGLPIQPTPCSSSTSQWMCMVTNMGNGGRLSPDGSGTTPTLMGPDHEYLVFADGERPMKMVVLRTKDGSPLPIDNPVPFSDTNAQTENICTSYGNKFIIENNYGKGVAAYEITGKPGQEEAKLLWVNNDVFAPNAVPLISGASNTVYIYEMQGANSNPLATTPQQWFVTAMDLNNGTVLWRRSIGTGLLYNSLYAPLSLDGGKHIYIGLFGGLLRVD